MASLITIAGFAQELKTPLELYELQTRVGGFIKFINISEGRTVVVAELAHKYAAVNETASKLAGKAVHGDVVVCSGSELAI